MCWLTSTGVCFQPPSPPESSNWRRCTRILTLPLTLAEWNPPHSSPGSRRGVIRYKRVNHFPQSREDATTLLFVVRAPPHPPRTEFPCIRPHPPEFVSFWQSKLPQLTPPSNITVPLTLIKQSVLSGHPSVAMPRNEYSKSPAEWEPHCHEITHLYLTPNKTLKEVQEIMRAKHGFHAT